MSLWERVRRWEALGNCVQVAVVGAGWVGQGLVHRLDRSPGMRPALVVNRTVANGILAYERAGYERAGIVVSDDVDKLTNAVDNGIPAVTASAEALVGIRSIDVVIEATGTLDFAAPLIVASLESGKHVVSINAEADATVGFLFHHVAEKCGRVYTISDGDQPGVLLRQIEYVEGMGFDVAVTINCKRHLDRYQNPATSRPYAERDGTSPAVTTAAGDGTKLNVENTVVANVRGTPPECRGMHGVHTTLDHALDDIRAALSHDGVVDYTLGGDFGAGVLVIASAPEHDLVQQSMRFYKMGPGPDYLFFSPYTLVHLEMPATVAQVVLDGVGLGRPSAPPVAEVVAVAKRDLRAGELLDGIGGFGCYGLIDTVEGASGLLPVGLAEHARLTRAIPRDSPIPLEAVDLDMDAPIVALRRRQDEIIGAG